MILDEITLNNFGIYAGNQSVKLTPPTAKRPIILFGGLNGGGKTTLMDALQLCLFGPQAKTSNRGTNSYRDYLSDCIHRHARIPRAGVSIKFRHTVAGAEETYCLYRSWSRENGTLDEFFQVTKNELHEPTLAANWSSQIDELFPVNIAHLFLFDGEQIEAYASENESSALISGGIQSLLGLDMVDQLEKDLRIYERRKRTEAKNDMVRAEIAEKERDLHTLRSRTEMLRRERNELSDQITQKRKELCALDEVYSKLGGGLFEKRAEIEHRLAVADSLVNDGADQMRGQAAGSLPLILVRHLLESVARRDLVEENGRRSRELSDLLEERDRTLLDHLNSYLAKEPVLQSLEKHLTRDRQRRMELGQHAPVLELVPSVRRDLHDLLEGGLTEDEAVFSLTLTRQREAEANASAARMEFENVPAPDVLAETVDQRNSIRAEIQALELRHAVLGHQIETGEREFDRGEQSLTRLLQARAADDSDSQDRIRILRHADRVRATLAAFRQAMVRRHVGRIEELVLDSYHQLLRKSSLVTKLLIDPERFTLTLFGRDGQVMNPGRLSAGERQLLAVALLWGLARASGRPLPTAIDTPLGRLDASHRMHLVERYFPRASHQMLLFSTDEEITGQYLDRLRPWIGRSYLLDYDDSTGQSMIVPGYFGS